MNEFNFNKCGWLIHIQKKRYLTVIQFFCEGLFLTLGAT